MYFLTVTPLYTIASLILSGLSFTAAYNAAPKQDLQSILFYILGSKPHIIIQLNFLYILLYLIGRVFMAFFIGKIRKNEFQLFQEKMVRYSMMNLLFVFYVLNPTHVYETLLWIMWFTVIGFVKLFEIVGKERSQFFISTLETDSFKHKKLLSMFGLILLSTLVLISFASYYFVEAGIGPLLLLLFECWVLLIETVQSIIIYGVFLLDLYHQDTSYSKTNFCYFIEYGLDSVRLLSTIGHSIHIWKVNGYSLTVIDMLLLYLAFRVFNEWRQKTTAFVQFLGVSATINNAFPNATQEDIDRLGDNCSICHDSLSPSNTKKLPCGHMYHVSCIMQWMRTRTSCPICSRPVITNNQVMNNNQWFSFSNMVTEAAQQRFTRIRQ
jgi:autocrine motility factor receptor